MAARDRWVGWDDRTQARNLQHVVNNSRFLLLPWVAAFNFLRKPTRQEPATASPPDWSGTAVGRISISYRSTMIRESSSAINC